MKIVNKVSLDRQTDRQHKYAIKVGLSVFILLLVVGITYAAFNYAGIGNLVNSISTETVTMTYTEGTNKISLENALPTEDETGMKLTTGDNVFDFTVYIKATNKQAIAYEVTAEKDETSTLGDNDVRIYLEKSLDKTNYEKVSDPSGYVPILENDKFGAKTGEMVLDAGTTSREQTYYYRLRMWVSKDYNVASESKFFTITVNVYGVGSNEIDAERIILSDTNVTMKQNESKQLSYTIKPDNASDKRVTWKSSNEKVAVVDSDGNVTGVGEGTAVITATAKDGEKASCNFTITKPDPADISVTATELDLKTNKKIALNAKVEPSNANTTKLTYESSNPDIVSVDEEGNLKTGTKAGTATITIKTETGITKKVTVTVTNQQAEGVTIDKTELEMITGSSEQLTATITPDDTIDKTITWTSSNNDVATVDNTGKVKAVGPGTATITATAVGGAKAESTIKVQNPLPTVVTATEKEVNMKSGTTHQLSATVAPDNARSKALTYTSSNPAVATVSDTGLVTALGAGSTTITLTTINGLTDTVTINVTNVKYTVNHNKMNIDGNGYTKADTETFSGKVGDKVTPSVKTYEGFTSPSTQSITLTEEDATINYNYDRKKYNLTLTDVKGADTNGSTATGEYYYETPITLKAIAKTGYTWSKWSDGEAEKTRSFKLTKDISVSPVVTTNTYTIDYDLVGGEVTNKNPNTYTVETERFTLNNPTKKGYTFAGWSGSNGTTPSTTVTVETGTTGKLSYTANWSKDTYKITYNLNDGKVSTANPSTYTVTDDAITLNNPSKTGYTFTGWTGSNGDTPQKTVSIEKGSVGDKTYNANYTANKYTVIFNKNSDKATGDMDSESFTYDNIKTLSSNTFKRSGYKFASWNTKEDGKGTSYADNSSVSNLSSTDGDTVNLYAIWTRDEYTINYNLNGGSLSGEKTSYNVDDNDLTLPIPAKNGYTFNGWTDDAGNKITTIPSGSTGNKTFNANWTLNTYTITYNLGDKGVNGTGNPASYTVENKDIVLNVPTRNGYTFTGWTGSNGTIPQTSVTIKTSDAENKTYTANWNANTYSITYNCNGGSGCTNGHYNIENDDITLPTPTRQGYTFTGWTGSNGTTPETTVKIPKGSTGDKSYTANWSVNKYTVTLNKGTGIDSVTGAGTYDYGTSVTINATVSTGYSWNNWTGTSTIATQKYTFTIPDKNVSYTANATPNTYTITWNGNGGTSSSTTSTKSYGSQIGTLPAATRSGYEFLGWYTATTGGSQISTTTTVTNDVIYYAQWKESSASETISGKTGTVADDSGNVRYTGADPNNYVRFNNELWRIVGSFANISNGTTSSKRIKLVKNGYAYTGTAFDSNSVNDYSTSTLKTTLNGTYYNGLTTEAKNMIEDAVWNLGGTPNNTSSTASQFYSAERSTTTYSGHATTWTGKVGLMYPSDYGYATAGGSTTSRASCLAKELYSWDSSSYSDCKNNDYLFDSSHRQWTITPCSGNSNDVFTVRNGGYVGGNRANYANGGNGVRPAVFLKSSISISGGSGTASDPYTLTG